MNEPSTTLVASFSRKLLKAFAHFWESLPNLCRGFRILKGSAKLTSPRSTTNTTTVLKSTVQYKTYSLSVDWGEHISAQIPCNVQPSDNMALKNELIAGMPVRDQGVFAADSPMGCIWLCYLKASSLGIGTVLNDNHYEWR